jgi:hypothetical protein
LFQQTDSAGQVGVLPVLDVPLVSLADLVAAAQALALAVMRGAGR